MVAYRPPKSNGVGSSPTALVYIKYRGVAQLAEQWSPKPKVEGSNPSTLVDYVK